MNLEFNENRKKRFVAIKEAFLQHDAAQCFQNSA